MGHRSLDDLYYNLLIPTNVAKFECFPSNFVSVNCNKEKIWSVVDGHVRSFLSPALVTTQN